MIIKNMLFEQIILYQNNFDLFEFSSPENVFLKPPNIPDKELSCLLPDHDRY